MGPRQFTCHERSERIAHSVRGVVTENCASVRSIDLSNSPDRMRAGGRASRTVLVRTTPQETFTLGFGLNG